ncbi:hypothetical protein EKH55_3294 [Sinorhizobium alkalisoli]|nr:hypothetical protein EKH55_3294 [Sinorhizobium alkalisoli]
MILWLGVKGLTDFERHDLADPDGLSHIVFIGPQRAAR